MRRHLAAVALALSLSLSAAVLCSLAGEAHADGSVQQKPKATKASVVALRNKLAKARDDMRVMAKAPPPQGLTAEQLKTYDAEMKKVLVLADETGAVVKKIDNQIDQIKADIDSMSEMGEMESLRLQMAMDRLSKLMSTLSNLLKKASDTASTITQNLK
jgi:hypothetical protein